MDVTPKTLFCSECDAGLADDLSALPPEYRLRVLEATRRLIQTYARMSGTTLPRHLPANVVQLRRP